MHLSGSGCVTLSLVTCARTVTGLVKGLNTPSETNYDGLIKNVKPLTGAVTPLWWSPP